MDLLSLIDEYQSLSNELEIKKAEVQLLNAKVLQARDNLANAMTEEEVPSITRGNFSYSVNPKTRFSKKAGNDEQFYELLSKEGLGSLIKNTVNANTLNATLNEIYENNDSQLPAQFQDYVNVYQYLDISRRKKN